ncbi:MAG: magnesium transporter [Clostridiales bacterium]|nr:magnesium transporter [Clostridiales bacterium]
MDWETVISRLNQMLAEGKTAQLRGALRMLNRVDVAAYLSGLDTDKMLLVFRLLPSSIASDVFSYMDDEQREKLIFSIGDREISRLVDDMFIDDAVDFLEDMPQDLVTRVLANVSPDTRDTINRFLKYPENSAGSIMTVEYCAYPGRFTVDEAMGEIKRTGLDKETVNTLYVVDENGILSGTVPLRKLICASGDAPLSSLMEKTFVSVQTTDDRELVASAVQKYDLLAVPVTDREGRMVGIITLDDILDVVQEETTEDIEMMSALTPSEDTYLNTGIWDLVKNRLPWLAIMLVASIFTGLIISHYENVLSSAALVGVALTACIPMLMDTGGNCGQQSSTLVIRSLATGEISPGNAIKVLWKESRVALIVAVVLASVCFCIQYLLFSRPLNVTLVISLSMVLAVILSKVIGGLLPLGAKALGLDPALTATPLITTLADTCSLLILFAIASATLL